MNTGLTADTPRSNVSIKLIVGLFFAILGVLLTAGNLDLIHSDDYLRFWPAVILAVGLVKLVEPGGGFAGGMLVAGGASILAYNLEWIRFSIFDLWPLLLIGFGGMMVARAMGFIPDGPRRQRSFAIFSSQEVTETSLDYRGGNIAAMFGGYEIDLSAADMTGPVVLDVFAMWGGIEIVVPDHWEVVSEVVPVMAGIDIKNGSRALADPSKKLFIRGFVMMAGVDVKNVSRSRS